MSGTLTFSAATGVIDKSGAGNIVLQTAGVTRATLGPQANSIDLTVGYGIAAGGFQPRAGSSGDRAPRPPTRSRSSSPSRWIRR